jgi:hypothetical protein
MPVVNFDLIVQAMARAKGDFNQSAYWSRPGLRIASHHFLNKTIRWT